MVSCCNLSHEVYAALGVDTEKALETLGSTPISVHCWQGDDGGGFEAPLGNAGLDLG